MSCHDMQPNALLIWQNFIIAKSGSYNDVALVDKLKYNQLSVSQLVDVDLDVLFRKSSSEVLDSSGKLVCGISYLGKSFKLISYFLNLLQSV
jgi:hypothetical protein